MPIESDTTSWPVVCPACGHSNDQGAPRCGACWGRLEGAQPVHPDEATRRAATYRRRRLRRRAIRWSVASLATLALLLALAYNVLDPTLSIPKATSALTATSGAGEWAMLGRDPARTGYSPAPAPRPLGPVRWRYKTAWFLSASPAVVGDTLYLATGDSRIVALDAATGAFRWEFPVPYPVDSSPAVAGDLLFVGLREGSLLALDRHSGALAWRFATGEAVVSSPAVDGGAVFFGSGDHKVYALDAMTGDRLWSFPTGGQVVSSPAVAGDVVATASIDGKLYLLERATGKLRLIFDFDQSIYGNATIHDGKVYVVTWSGAMAAIATNEREVPFDRARRRIWFQLWQWDFLGPPPPPRGLVWAYRDKGIQWQEGGPAVGGGLVVFGADDRTLRALDAETGREVWRYKTLDAIRQSPVIAGDTVYVGDMGGTVYGLDLASGKEVFRFTTGGPVMASPTYAGGILYIASRDGVLYAVE